MTVSHETLMAFVDGELSPEEEKLVLVALERYPEARAYVEQQRNLRTHLQADFEHVLRAPFPERLEKALAHGARAQERPSAGPYRSRMAWLVKEMSGAAKYLRMPVVTAAGFAVGILVATWGGAAPIAHENGLTVARGALENALSRQLASEQDDRAEMRIGVTFQNHDGAVCRSFFGGEALPGLAGIACRDSDNWRIDMLAPIEDSGDAPYQRASATMPDMLRDRVTAMIADAPFDAERERIARDDGWRVP